MKDSAISSTLTTPFLGVRCETLVFSFLCSFKVREKFFRVSQDFISDDTILVNCSATEGLTQKKKTFTITSVDHRYNYCTKKFFSSCVQDKRNLPDKFNSKFYFALKAHHVIMPTIYISDKSLKSVDPEKWVVTTSTFSFAHNFTPFEDENVFLRMNASWSILTRTLSKTAFKNASPTRH